MITLHHTHLWGYILLSIVCLWCAARWIPSLCKMWCLDIRLCSICTPSATLIIHCAYSISRVILSFSSLCETVGELEQFPSCVLTNRTFLWHVHSQRVQELLTDIMKGKSFFFFPQHSTYFCFRWCKEVFTRQGNLLSVLKPPQSLSQRKSRQSRGD